MFRVSPENSIHSDELLNSLAPIPLSPSFSFLSLGVCVCVWEANGVGFVVPLHVNSQRLLEGRSELSV